MAFLRPCLDGIGCGSSLRRSTCHGYTPVTTHIWPPSLQLWWFSGRSGELRCISTQTGATADPGNLPGSYGWSCVFMGNKFYIVQENVFSKVRSELQNISFNLNAAGENKCKISDQWVSLFWNPWNTIYISVAEKRIAPWSWRALYNRLERHRPAPDHRVFVCVYVQVASLPLLPWQVPLDTPVFLYLDCSSYIPPASIKSHIYMCVCL